MLRAVGIELNERTFGTLPDSGTLRRIVQSAFIFIRLHHDMRTLMG